MSFPTNQAINKESLKEKLVTVPNSCWRELALKKGEDEYCFFIVAMPFYVKGIISPIEVEIRFTVLDQQFLIVRNYGIQDKPARLGEKRQVQLANEIETFLKDAIWETLSDETVAYGFYHKLYCEERPLHNCETNTWNYDLEYEQSYYRLTAFGVEDYYPLIHLQYRLHVHVNLRNKADLVNQEVIFYSDALYTNVVHHKEHFWMDGELKRKSFILSQTQETLYQPIQNPYGEFLLFQETQQVFKRMYGYHLTQPLKLFPQKISELTSGLRVFNYHSALTWLEFTTSNQISPELNTYKRSSEIEIELVVLAQRVKEDRFVPYQVGDYICLNPEESNHQYREYGLIEEVTNLESGSYKVWLENDRFNLREKEFHHSQVERVKHPTQNQQHQLVYIEEEGFGILDYEGYHCARIEKSTLDYDYSLHQHTLSKTIKTYTNDKVFLATNPSLLTEWETFLTIKNPFKSIETYCLSHPNWFFVTQWLIHCDLMFQDESLDMDDLSFLFLLYHLIQLDETESLVFDLMLKTSAIPRYRSKDVTLSYGQKFIKTFIQTPLGKTYFKSYVSPTI